MSNIKGARRTRGPKWFYDKHGCFVSPIIDHIYRRVETVRTASKISTRLTDYIIYPYGCHGDALAKFILLAQAEGYAVTIDGRSEYHPNTFKIILRKKEL